MAIQYLTYTQNGVAKKAKLQEEALNKLLTDPSVSGLTRYTSESLMERGYTTIVCSDGSCDTRKQLRD